VKLKVDDMTSRHSTYIENPWKAMLARAALEPSFLWEYHVLISRKIWLRMAYVVGQHGETAYGIRVVWKRTSCKSSSPEVMVMTYGQQSGF
jgi:hypothetical protein